MGYEAATSSMMNAQDADGRHSSGRRFALARGVPFVLSFHLGAVLEGRVVEETQFTDAVNCGLREVLWLGRVQQHVDVVDQAFDEELGEEAVWISCSALRFLVS